MLDKLKEKDNEADAAIKKLEEENAKVSMFKKLLPFNNPSYLIVSGVISSVFLGTMQPVVGIILSKLLAYLSATWEMLDAMDPETTGRQYLEQEVKFYSIIMGILALGGVIGSMTQKRSFGTLGENVTEKIRQVLYTSILRKNIGWFDDRENATSVLTSAMAQDTSVINGVSTESLAP